MLFYIDPERTDRSYQTLIYEVCEFFNIIINSKFLFIFNVELLFFFFWIG